MGSGLGSAVGLGLGAEGAGVGSALGFFVGRGLGSEEGLGVGCSINCEKDDDNNSRYRKIRSISFGFSPRVYMVIVSRKPTSLNGLLHS